MIPLHKLCDVYKETKAYDRIDKFCQMIATSRHFKHWGRWYVKHYDGDGDIGFSYWMYTDDHGIQHLVMENYWDIHDDVLYFGNIANRQPLKLPVRRK